MKIQKLSDTTFSIPSPNQIINIQQIQARKESAQYRLEISQKEIELCDTLLQQGKMVGVDLDIKENDVK